MNIIGKYYRLVCITMIIVVIGGVNGLAQEGKEVVYRDYTHMEADLLDSLKRDEVKTLFRGVHVLRQQAQQVKESTPAPVGISTGREEKIEPTRYDREEKGQRVDCQQVSSCDDASGRSDRLGNGSRVIERRDLCLELPCVLGISGLNS